MGNLITLEEYKLDQGLNKADKDEQLSILISQVSDIIKKYLNMNLVPSGTEVTEIINLDYDSDTIFLDNYPVANIVSFTALDLYGVDSTVRLPVPTSTYILDGENGKLLRTAGYWPRGKGILTVTYTVGGPATEEEVSPALKRAAIDLVKYYEKTEYVDSKSIRGTTINNSTGTGNANSPSTNFPPHIQRILDMYR